MMPTLHPTLALSHTAYYPYDFTAIVMLGNHRSQALLVVPEVDPDLARTRLSPLRP